MKKVVIALIIFNFQFSFFNSAMGQGIVPEQRHAVNFESRKGETFMVYIDGDVVNRMPQSRAMVNEVSNQTHEVVVVLRSPEQKAAVLQLLPGEPVVTVYVDYDVRLEKLLLYTPSYNLAERASSISSISSVSSVSGDDSIVVDSGKVRLVTEEELVAMQLRMKNQPFDSDRLALGKVIVASSSLTAEQIGRLAAMIDYSASQVEFLKYAYSYCVDPKNYYKATEVLTFNSDKRKVMDFIATQ